MDFYYLSKIIYVWSFSPKQNAELAEQFKNEGNTFYKGTEYRKSIDLYTKAIELCPDTASYYGNRAAAYMMIQKYKLAIEDSKTATSIDPNFVKVSSHAGWYLKNF